MNVGQRQAAADPQIRYKLQSQTEKHFKQQNIKQVINEQRRRNKGGRAERT